MTYSQYIRRPTRRIKVFTEQVTIYSKYLHLKGIQTYSSSLLNDPAYKCFLEASSDIQIYKTNGLIRTVVSENELPIISQVIYRAGDSRYI